LTSSSAGAAEVDSSPLLLVVSASPCLLSKPADGGSDVENGWLTGPVNVAASLIETCRRSWVDGETVETIGDENYHDEGMMIIF